MKKDRDEFDFLEEKGAGVLGKILAAVGAVALIVVFCALVWVMTHREQREPIQSTSPSDEAGVDVPVGETLPADRYEPEPQETGSGQEELPGGEDFPDVAMDFTQVEETVTAKDVTNLRSEPSTNGGDATVVVQLKNGQTAVRTGINEVTGWSRVVYGGQVLYAVNQYLTTEISGEAGEQEKGADTQEDESSPSQPPAGEDSPQAREPEETESPVQEPETAGSGEPASAAEPQEGLAAGGEGASQEGQAPAGGVAQEGADPPAHGLSQDGKSFATYDGRVITFQEADDWVSPKNRVNLRGEPSTSEGNGTIHATLEYGEKVHRIGVSQTEGSQGWSQVEYNGEILYAVTSYLYVVEE